MVGQCWHLHLQPGGSLVPLLAQDVCLYIVIYEYFHSCNEFVLLFTCICVGFIIFLYLS